MCFDHRVLHSSGETAELTGLNRDAIAVDFDHDGPFQNHEDLVALLVGMRSFVVPLGAGVVEPELKAIGLPRDRAPRFATCEQSRVIRQRRMVESTGLGHPHTLPALEGLCRR
jgi:hypothetical protein